MSDDILSLNPHIEWQAAEPLIPHGGAMRFIDELCANTLGLVARARIRNDNPLLTTLGLLPAHAGIEYMAQALAGQKGLQQQDDIKNGVIVGIKNVKIFRPNFFSEGELLVYVDHLEHEGPYQVAQCRVIQGEPIIAAELSVMETSHVN
jgi:predicted hotdog family 3-hydroxylacyl-ACP dehydratase